MDLTPEPKENELLRFRFTPLIYADAFHREHH